MEDDVKKVKKVSLITVHANPLANVRKSAKLAQMLTG